MQVTDTRSIQTAFAKAYRRIGVVIGLEAARVYDTQGGNLRFALRLDRHRRAMASPIPTMVKIENGELPPGQVAGAKYLLLGMVQSTGPLVRITARIVEVESAVVLKTARSDAKYGIEGLERAIGTLVNDLARVDEPAAALMAR